jgi:hypothetical protein
MTVEIKTSSAGSSAPDSRRQLPTGRAAAAILAAGIGSLALGVLALATDALPRLAHWMILWRPTGPLSGVTSATVAIWLLAWAALARRWARREVALGPIAAWAFAMLAAGLLLTFPPFMDLVQGK